MSCCAMVVPCLDWNFEYQQAGKPLKDSIDKIAVPFSEALPREIVQKSLGSDPQQVGFVTCSVLTRVLAEPNLYIQMNNDVPLTMKRLLLTCVKKVLDGTDN